MISQLLLEGHAILQDEYPISIMQILILDYVDYSSFPTGGILTFSRNLLKAFGDELWLVGITTDKDTPIGSWIKKEFDGKTFFFFAIDYVKNTQSKPFVPLRIRNLFFLSLYIRKILKGNVFDVALTQSHESLFCLTRYKLNLFFYFPGLENPLNISRYWFAQPLKGLFQFLFKNCLKRCKKILVAADQKSISDYINNMGLQSIKDRFVFFPTRIDSNIFRPRNLYEARAMLGLRRDKIIVVTSGRLASFKGWKFLIDSFDIFRKNHDNSILYFLGDGEDSELIDDYIKTKGLTDQVALLGRVRQDELAVYLNAADVYVMGSLHEGWCTSLLESVASGTRSVVTQFSSAEDLIQEGINGYVVKSRDEHLFAIRMNDALQLSTNRTLQVPAVYDIKSLKDELCRLCA